MLKKEVSISMIESGFHSMSNQKNPHLNEGLNIPPSPVLDSQTPTTALPKYFGVTSIAKQVVASFNINSKQLSGVLGLSNEDGVEAKNMIISKTMQDNELRMAGLGSKVPSTFNDNKIDADYARKNAIGDDGITPSDMPKFDSKKDMMRPR